VKTRWTFALILLVAAALVRADGPADNVSADVRPVPPPGLAIPDGDRTDLQAGADALGKEIDGLRTALKGKPALLDLLPDVQIYHNAVRYALTYNEFFGSTRTPAETERSVKSQVALARTLLKQGTERAAQLREGKPAWTTQTGPIVRGYVSKIDGSVQPYGLFVPASYKPDYPHRYRLDFWAHGRGETLSELNFIDGCQKSGGPFTPRDAFVVQLYGRYCCANKLAGEVDLFESLESVKKHYPIDENRLVVRGFSMGGAAAWHFAVHYPSVFAAAAPGAGFSETPDFLKVFQKETLKPSDYEQKLWHMYDCTDYALNLFNLPTVAYSGEIDSQKQAADVMAVALKKEGIDLAHVIGPKTAHAYEAEAKKEVIRRIDSIVERGRNPVPEQVRFTTWTLRYNNAFWVTLDGLDHHWEQARIAAHLTHRQGDSKTDVVVGVQGVTAFTLSMAPGECPLENVGKPLVLIHDYERGIKDMPANSLEAAPVLSDRSWVAHFRKVDGKWQTVDSANDGSLAKRHGLQGPIDDAFLDSFLMVRPTGKPLNDKVGTWAEKEMAHAVDHWRKQFRGEARIKSDDAVTDADIKEHNLVLWGDPQSNKVLAKIADKLPVRWDSKGLVFGSKTYETCVPLMIYPNPLNPKRYVVLNSGFTFREYDYLNNARQVPKLPDYAIIDVSVPVSSRLPGGVVTAGFFDEHWNLPAPK
jgi:pimeloyl-ACP methyl ester carboxylesterase